MKLALLTLILIMSVYGNDTYANAKKAEKKKDYFVAEKLYKEGCDLGNNKSCLGLTNLYFNGKGEHGNMTVVYKLSKMLCDQNDAEGCFFLGYLYNKGKGVSENIDLAKKTLDKACNLGSNKACMNLSEICLSSKDYSLAIKSLKKSYENGNSGAGMSLGSIYYSGIGVTKNMNKALDYFYKACEKDKLSTACALLGTHYIQKNQYLLGKKYSQKACNMKPDKGGGIDIKKLIAESCTNLGLLYAKGMGVELSMYKAKKYFRKACDMELDQACKYYNRTLQK